MPSSAQDVRGKFIAGRANAGKTTLLRKVYNATGKPKIFNCKGNQVDPTLKMKQFVSECASARELNECIHAIWQAIVSTRLYLII